MTEKICRLCLQTIIKNYQKISESLLRTLKLNLNISNEIVICVECANYLRVLTNFKTVGEYMQDRTLPLSNPKNDASLHLVTVKTTNNPKSPMGMEVKCNFCTKTRERKGFVSLNQSRKYESLRNMLKQHIPEMNILNNTQELVTCEICLDALQGVSRFISKCLEVEESINKYTEIERIDDKGQIELKEVQRFTFKPTVEFKIEPFDESYLGNGWNQIKKEHTMIAEAEIKHEKEINTPELIIKTEDVDVKSKRSNYDSFQEPMIGNKIIDDPLRISRFLSETRRKKNMKSHETISKIKMFNCEECSYETKHKHRLKSHLLTHANLSAINMFKCEMCSYQTYRKDILKRHLLTHKSPSEINMFKCEMCSYGTNIKSYLRQHKLTHKSRSEINMFSCKMCSYETKYKHCLKIHLLAHKSPAEINMYKCEICPFETKHKDNLRKHLFIHKNPSEIATFKCETCTYETKNKSCLKKHQLIHKSPSETDTFKCEMCPYEAKRKYHLKRHFLTHKSYSEVTMFKCETCSYETKHKYYLKSHLMSHKSPSEINMFNCEMCSYETKYKRSLKVHLLTHKTSSDIKFQM